jgi:uncharacterized protein YjlB
MLLEPERLLLAVTPEFPNSRLPVLVYRSVLEGVRDLASELEAMFARHGWIGSWRNGLYREHHFHSTAHETLGIYRGSVDVRLGGPTGKLLTLNAADVVVIPAGVAHKNEGQSSDFAVVGAYPTGTTADLRYRTTAEVERKVAAVPMPERDPVSGQISRWR